MVSCGVKGHNWGSEHDPDTTECSPSAMNKGKYIMYTYSVSGYDPNNKVRLRLRHLVTLLACDRYRGGKQVLHFLP